MRQREQKFILLILLAYLFVGCAKQESVASSTQSMETLEQEATKEVVTQIDKTRVIQPKTYPIELEEMLSSVPIGSEIYIEERKNGEWYLKIEKTFNPQNVEEKSTQPTYGETILI